MSGELACLSERVAAAVKIIESSQSCKKAVGPANEAPACCPQGHSLVDYVESDEGECDGCESAINSGDHVMDCRQCNWKLCRHCHRGPTLDSLLERVLKLESSDGSTSLAVSLEKIHVIPDGRYAQPSVSVLGGTMWFPLRHAQRHTFDLRLSCGRVHPVEM